MEVEQAGSQSGKGELRSGGVEQRDREEETLRVVRRSAGRGVFRWGHRGHLGARRERNRDDT